MIYSTGLVNFLQQFGSLAQALINGTFEIFSGSAPATGDDAETGTKLVTVSLASGAVTKEVLATCLVALTGGASGNVSSITIGGYEVLGATVNYDTSLANTASLIVAQINRYSAESVLKCSASVSGTDITISAPPGTGTALNGKAVVVTSSTITTTINGGSADNMGEGAGGSTAGVAAVNGLKFGNVSAGKLAKGTSAWSGVIANTGVAGYFRIKGSITDAGGVSTTAIRLQGTCGTSGSGADYIMANTTLTATQTHTVDTWEHTLDKTQV